MKNNSVVFFTDHIEKYTRLAEMLESNVSLSVCSYSSESSWEDIDFYSGRNVCFVLDEIPEDKNAVWIISKLFEDNLFAEVPILFTSYDAMYEFDKMGFASFAYDVLPEPFDYELAYRRFLNIMELRQLKFQIYNLTQIHTKRILNQANKLKEQSAKMQSMNYDLVELLVAAIESRDMESGEHIKRIRYFTKALTESVMENCPEYGITKEQADFIYYASSVHDIGKIAIPDAIMLKPDRLTPDEYEIMKTHTTRGYNLLNMLDDISESNQYFKYCQEICRYHHERWDGRGYPDGLKGDDTPISAQIVALCDCYDALTSNRPYKTALDHQDAVDLILNGGCGVFSPQIIKSFTSCLNEFAKIVEQFRNNPSESTDDNLFRPIILPANTTVPVSPERISYLNETEDRILSSHDIVFDADIKNGYFSVLRGNWTIFFPYVPKNFTEVISQCLKICHPADAARFASKVNLNFFSELVKQGKDKTRIEFRLIHNGVEYLAVGVIVFVVDDDRNLIGLNGIFNIYDDEEILTDIKRGFGVTDTLTGLSLQKQFEKDVNSYIKSKPESKNILIHIDIDNMSLCNNIFGYEYGNTLIKEFASKLKGITSKNTILCKAASDKFMLFVKDVVNQAELVVFIENLHNLLRKPYTTATESGEFTASMGIARYPNDGKDFKELYMASEYAAKTAKSNGQGSYAFFNNTMHMLSSMSADDPSDRGVRNEEEYKPIFVPVIDARTNELICYDYLPYSMYNDSVCYTTEAYYELNKNSPNSKNLSILAIKTLLFTMIKLKAQGNNIPPVAVYSMITSDDLPSFVQELTSFTTENDVKGVDMTILLPQDILESVHINRLKSISDHLRKIGFKFGLYLLGSRYIHNGCHSRDIFDRFVMKSEYIEHSIASGSHLGYCAETLNLLGKFAKNITIPAIVGDYDRDVMFEAGVSNFSCIEQFVSGTDELISDFKKRTLRGTEVSTTTTRVSSMEPSIAYHDILNSNLVWMFYDIKKKRFSVTPNAKRVLGFDFLESNIQIGLTDIMSRLHPDDTTLFMEQISKVRMNLEVVSFDIRIRPTAASTDYITLGLMVLAATDESGAQVRYQCAISKKS